MLRRLNFDCCDMTGCAGSVTMLEVRLIGEAVVYRICAVGNDWMRRKLSMVWRLYMKAASRYCVLVLLLRLDAPEVAMMLMHDVY